MRADLITITYRRAYAEYMVEQRSAPLATYYTDDVADAVGTALLMARPKQLSIAITSKVSLSKITPFLSELNAHNIKVQQS